MEDQTYRTAGHGAIDDAEILRRRIAAQQRQIALLNGLLKRFLGDTDALFRSRTWRIGYGVAQALRAALRPFGVRGLEQHLGPAHFRAIVESVPAFDDRAARLLPGLEQIRTRNAGPYLKLDVDVALTDLWRAAASESGVA